METRRRLLGITPAQWSQRHSNRRSICAPSDMRPGCPLWTVSHRGRPRYLADCQGRATLNVRSTSTHARWTARALDGVNEQVIS